MPHPSSQANLSSQPAPRWFVAGDLNGFFGLVVDNLSILGFIAFAAVCELVGRIRRG